MNEKLDEINKRIENIKVSADYIKFVIVLMNVVELIREEYYE